MIEIRTQRNARCLTLDVYVMVRPRSMNAVSVLQETDTGIWEWVSFEAGIAYNPTFSIPEDSCAGLVEDLARDGYRPKQQDQQGRVEAVTAHKDSLEQILAKVLPAALRAEALD